MRFAPVALVVGFAGTILASYLQGPAVASTDSLVAAMSPAAEITASIPVDGQPAAGEALRLIDLRNGASCKVNGPVEDDVVHRVPMGPACAKSPDLARVAYWERKDDGSLVMTDHHGETVLEFMPGDGVMYESVYPNNALITIVPARG